MEGHGLTNAPSIGTGWVNLCLLWAVGGEVAVVIHIELPFVCACALQELADSAFWVGLGSGLGIEAPWLPCIVDGLEDVVWVVGVDFDRGLSP